MKKFAVALCALSLAVTPAYLSAQTETGNAIAVEQGWNGVWMMEGAEPTISGFVEDYDPGNRAATYPLTSPDADWNEEGERRMAEMIASIPSRKSTGWGYPMMMAGSAPFEFIIADKEVVIVNPYRDIRRVFTDGRGLPPEDERWPTTWGTSAGHWEGDTLVIETVAVRDPSVYLFLVPPVSSEAHYIERLHMVGPDRIESEITITDPVTLNSPLVAKVAYLRQQYLDIVTFDSFENDRSEVVDGLFTILPDGENAD